MGSLYQDGERCNPESDPRLLSAMLDSLKHSFMFADTDHVIRYMNPAATANYKQGESLLGTNLLDCHNEQSGAMILEIFAEMQDGLDEKLITDNEKHRIYMRAVRDEDGNVLGYYERYEPPKGS